MTELATRMVSAQVDDATLDLRGMTRRQIADDIIEIAMRPDGAAVPYEPGSRLVVTLPNGEMRAYSLVN